MTGRKGDASAVARLCRRHGLNVRQLRAVTGTTPKLARALWSGQAANKHDDEIATVVNRLIAALEHSTSRFEGSGRPPVGPVEDCGNRGLTLTTGVLLKALLDSPAVREITLATPGLASGLAELREAGLVEYAGDDLLLSATTVEAFDHDEWRAVRDVLAMPS